MVAEWLLNSATIILWLQNDCFNSVQDGYRARLKSVQTHVDIYIPNISRFWLWVKLVFAQVNPKIAQKFQMSKCYFVLCSVG